MNKSEQALRDVAYIITFKSKDSSERERSEAFNNLYSNHERQLMQHLLRYTRSIEDAKDLRVIVFQKVYENIKNFDETKGAFSTWLYKIATGTAIDFNRKKNIEVLSTDGLTEKSRESEGFGEFQIKGQGKNPEEILIGDDNMEEILKAFESFENEQTREILRLKFLEGKTYDEIAEELDIDSNSSTIRVTVNRGRDKLRSILKDINN
jgi:RNA polymerase sigma-70 factor (ECF subfamily)